MRKVRKTASPFRYDLNQVPYDYTVEVRNKFKGRDLIECLMNYGRRFMTLKKCKKAKWLSEEALQIAVQRREAKGKEKRKNILI